MRKCRRQVADLVRQNSPVYLAMILSAWTEDDEIYVGVIQRKLAWGIAVTQLRRAQDKLLSDLTDQVLQISAQLNSKKQSELSRRVAVFNALTNLAP